MKVTSERVPDSQVVLNIEVDPETVEKYLQQAYRSLVNRVNIPGFRRGKAPRRVVERVLGKEALVQESMEKLLPEMYRQAVEETGIKPADQPEIDVVQKEPLVIKATVPVRPTVELGDYRQIRLAREEVTVRDEEVTLALSELRQNHATWEPVERPVQWGDRVTVDVKALTTPTPLLYSAGGDALLQSAQAQTINDEKGAEIIVATDLYAAGPDFAEKLVGLEPHQEAEFQVSYPATYHNRQLADKTITFQVVVHAVKEKRLPELDDDFARAAGHDSLEALRAALRATLLLQASADEEARLARFVVERAVEWASVEIPSTAVGKEVDHLVERARQRLMAQKLTMEQFLAISKKSEEEWRDELRPVAVQNLKTFLVLQEIAQAEGIEASPEEVQRLLQIPREGEKSRRPKLDPEEARQSVALNLRQQGVIRRLVAIATGEYQARPGEAQAQDVTPESREEGPGTEESVRIESEQETTAEQG